MSLDKIHEQLETLINAAEQKELEADVKLTGSPKYLFRAWDIRITVTDGDWIRGYNIELGDMPAGTHQEQFNAGIEKALSWIKGLPSPEERARETLARMYEEIKKNNEDEASSRAMQAAREAMLQWATDEIARLSENIITHQQS